jgi:hypothetical protein
MKISKGEDESALVDGQFVLAELAAAEVVQMVMETAVAEAVVGNLADGPGLFAVLAEGPEGRDPPPWGLS